MVKHCSPCRQRKSLKFKLINWEATKSKYNYLDDHVLQKSDSVVIICKCGVPKDMIWRSVRSHSSLCRSCTSKDLWDNPEYRGKLDVVMSSEQYKEKHVVACQTEEHRAKLASTSKKNWDNDKYRTDIVAKINEFVKTDSYIQKQSEASKRKWENEEYRRKQALGAQRKNTFEFRQYISDIVKEYWTDERKTEVSEHIKELWTNDDYRHKTAMASKEAMANPDIRQAISDRVIELWQNKEYRTKMIKMLGENSRRMWQNQEFRERMAVARASQSNTTSSIQLQLYKYLNDLGLEYHKEGTETAIGYYVFDCMIPKQGSMRKHLLVECQGDYWHSLPKAIRNDKSKFTYIDRYFPEHEIMYVWEHEFSAKDRVLDRLKLKLGINIDIIDFNFRDVQIKKVLSRDIKSFLDAYHYIGKGRGGECFGAYLKDELIACVVFSSPLRQNTAGQFGLVDGNIRELSRLCIHPSYHKKNFASWLISKATRNIKEFIVAYADTTVGHDGTIYKAANFRLHHEVAPNYWYVDGDGYVMHKKTLYQRARRMSMKESDFAEKYKYFKKWGGKKLCFVLTR